MMRALAVGGRDLDVMRIVARAGIDAPEGWDRFDASFDRIRADVLRVLKANVRGVRDQELIFRTRCAAGLLNWLVLAPVGVELRNKSEKQIERRLVPVLAGTFRGTSSADRGAAHPNNSINCLTTILRVSILNQVLDLLLRRTTQRQEALQS